MIDSLDKVFRSWKNLVLPQKPLAVVRKRKAPPAPTGFGRR